MQLARTVPGVRVPSKRITSRGSTRFSRRRMGMDARALRPALSRRVLAGVLLALVPALGGASYKTANFAVEAPTAEAARRVGDHAEACRKAIAVAWLGQEMPA